MSEPAPASEAAPASEPTPASEAAHHLPSRSRIWWVEHAAVVLLAVTSILTAWSAYQSSRWNGEMALAFSAANGLRAESVRTSTGAGQEAIVDVQTFIAWSEAVGAGDVALAVYLRDRFRPEFRVAFDEWLGRPPGTTVSPAQVPPGTPFSNYKPADYVRAEELAVEAEAALDRARTNNQRSDNYVLTTVLFALVLFCAGVASRFRDPRLGAVLIGIGMVVSTIGLVALFLQPVSISL